MQVVLAIRKPMGMVGDVQAHLGLGQGRPKVPQGHLLGRWGGAGNLKFGVQVVLAIRKPVGMVGDVQAHLGLG